ncbi:MAG: peptide deformylase [Alphaproteobacteria bacterium]|nr:peptide deformylase [Alphaproteobacteria bacterium]
MLLKIARMGHPVLRRRAEEVADPTALEIHALVADMVETMQDAPGQGLAAPQIHVPLRIVVYLRPSVDPAPNSPRALQVLINPVIEVIDGTETLGVEGCLSVPGLRGIVPRATTIRCRAVDLEGRVIDEVVSGHHARVIQHECDHLDGILYPRRMNDLSLLVFESELKHLLAREEEAS